jgi:hypothetical protein
MNAKSTFDLKMMVQGRVCTVLAIVPDAADGGTGLTAGLAKALRWDSPVHDHGRMLAEWGVHCQRHPDDDACGPLCAIKRAVDLADSNPTL